MSDRIVPHYDLLVWLAHSVFCVTNSAPTVESAGSVGNCCVDVSSMLARAGNHCGSLVVGTAAKGGR